MPLPPIPAYQRLRSYRIDNRGPSGVSFSTEGTKLYELPFLSCQKSRFRQVFCDGYHPNSIPRRISRSYFWLWLRRSDCDGIWCFFDSLVAPVLKMSLGFRFGHSSLFQGRDFRCVSFWNLLCNHRGTYRLAVLEPRPHKFSLNDIILVEFKDPCSAK